MEMIYLRDALLLAALLGSCAHTERVEQASSGQGDANLSLSLSPEDLGEKCGACVLIEADKNLTQLFVDAEGDFRVFSDLDGELAPLSDLQKAGGPCGELAREVWAPVPGNQGSLSVCVVLDEEVFEGQISIGAKAADECQELRLAIECAAEQPSNPRPCDLENRLCPPP